MADEELKKLLKGVVDSNQKIFKSQQEEIRALTQALAEVTKRLADVKPTGSENNQSNGTSDQCKSFEALVNMLETFQYDPENNNSFEAWFERYADVFNKEAVTLGDDGKVRLILMKMETSANERYRHSILPQKPGDISFADTIARLKALFKKKMSLIRSRWTCLQITKNSGEELSAYGARVNKLAEDFKLSDLNVDQFKVLIFILGLRETNDKSIRTRLMNLLDKTKPEDIKLQTMIEEAERIMEIDRDSALGTSEESPMVINQVATPKSHSKSNHRSRKSRSNTSNTSASTATSTKTPKTPCWKCGSLHYVKDCGYKEHTCKRCHVVGHKEGYCEAIGNRPKTSPTAQVNVIQLPAIKQATEELGQDRKFIDVIVNNIKIAFQYDSAADVTILNQQSWNMIGCPPLIPSHIQPVDCQKNSMEIIGDILVNIELNGEKRTARCTVTNKCDNLFGIPWIKLFSLWDKPASAFCNQVTAPPKDSAGLVRELQESFAPVFEKTLGKCNEFKASLHLQPNASPIFRQKRPVPFHVMALVTEELERLEQSGIISPVQFSLYAAPIVVVKKPNGAIRICGDYSTGLNDTLLSHEYPIPTPEEIFASLSNCKYFTQVDLSDAYLQIEVDDESKKLLTINTHKGLFVFNRLCPGVKPAAGIFQQAMETILAGIEGVTIYFDDVLISSSDFDHHRSTLLSVFDRLKKYNLKVRFEKCNFLQKEVRYLGVIVDSRGQRPDPAKTASIVSMPPPSNISQVRAFLGAIGFYGRFIKSMSTIRAPIDKLLRKDEPFIWSKECDQAFTTFKNILTSDLLLTHYDPQLPIMIAADASSTGIGCVAYHTYTDGSVKAFHHASRRLTSAEQRYSQVEKEGLGIIFAVKKFHKYIWGRRFTIYTDHRPLLTIFGSNKGVPVHTANRLQRWAIILLGYDFDIKFIGTNEFGHADILSRLIAQQPQNKEDIVIANIGTEEELNITARELSSFSPVSFNSIRAATLKDETLILLKQYITSGWPIKSTIKSMDVFNYYNIRHELQIINDVVLYRDRTVVPPCYRNRILDTLHKAHPGIVRMKSLARCYVYWPGLDAAIKQVVESCMACQQALKSPPKTCLSAWPTPPHPWFRAHADFAGPINGMWYFIIVDAYSKWPEVYPMSTTTASSTINALRDLCGRYGSMEKLVTDNGPQFTSGSFRDYCSKEAIDHILTAPYMPMSNGQAERFVDTFKRALVKSQKKDNEAITEFLRNYRATPNDRAPCGLSPAEIQFGRRIRLPISIVRAPIHHQLDRDTEMEDQFNSKHGAKQRHFQEGEMVIIKMNPNTDWRPATIIEPIGAVLYNVLAQGKVVRAHKNQIRKSRCNKQDDEFPIDVLLDYPLCDPAPIPTTPTQRPNWRAVSRSSPVNLRPRK